MIEQDKESRQPIAIRVPGKIMLAFSGICTIFAMMGLTPVLPAIAAHFSQYPQAEMLTRLLVSLIGVMAVIASPFAGYVADRIGLRRLMLIGQATYGVAGIACFFVDNLYGLIALRLVVGLAGAAVGSVMLALIATRSTGHTRNAWMGYIATFGTLIAIMLIPLSGYMGRHGWQWPFLIHIVSLPLFILAYIGLDPDVDKPRSTTATGTGAKIPVAMILVAIATGIVGATSLLYVPFHLRDIGESDPARISGAILPATLISATVAFLYGRVRQHLSITAVFCIGFAVTGIGLALIAHASSLTEVVIEQMLMGVGSGLLAPNVYALAAATGSDAHRATIMGFARGGLVGGPILGQLALEPIVLHSNAGVGLLVLALFAITLAFIHGWQVRARAPQQA